MSAFIVNQTTMHHIVSAGFTMGGRAHELFGVSTADELGQLLFEMNAQAVAQRYQELPEKIDYKYIQTECDLYKAFMSIECLLYQCSEGDIPDSEHYRNLEELKARIASAIIWATPRYIALTDEGFWG